MVSKRKFKLILIAVHERFLFLIKGDYKNPLSFNEKLKNYMLLENMSDDRISELNSVFENESLTARRINPSGNDDARYFLFIEDLKKKSVLNELKNNLTKSINDMSSIKLELGFVMMNETVPTANGLGSGGGWHRDSAYGQLKVMVYLNDVTEKNGAFQIINDSRVFCLTNKYDSLLNKTSILRVDGDTALEYDANTITGQAGTTLAFNPENIHRGSPCKEGSRRAATFYFFPKSRVNEMVREFKLDIDNMKRN